MFLDFFRLSINSLSHRKRRSWLTIIGTLIGIMAVVSLISIGQGLENSVQSELNELGGDQVFVSPGGGISGRFSDTTFELTEDDLEAVRRSNSVDIAEGMISGNSQVTFRRQTEHMTVVGVPATDEAVEVYGIENTAGRSLRPGDTGSVLVEEDEATEAFDEEVLLRSSLEIEGEGYSVVGKYTTSDAVSGMSGVMMPMEQAREVLGKQDEYDEITAQVREGYAPEEAAEEIRRNLRNERGVEEGDETFNVRTAEDIIRSFNNQLSVIRGVLLGIGGISLLVGGIGIMNTMYTSVTERTREIGVMKAIGATKRQILALFMIESGMVGMIGGLLGATVGIGLSYVAGVAIRRSVSIPFQPYVSIELMLGSVFFSFIIGMISGALPARKASRKEPVEALRFG
jgi:putative ABC transport system permease protein